MSDNSLTPTRQQAIISINDGLCYRCIYVVIRHWKQISARVLFDIATNYFISAYVSYSETTENLTDATPPETGDIYSHPSKRLWRRMEHIYMDIGPPRLPSRGYKDDPSGKEEQCPEQNGDIHPAMNLSVLWILRGSVVLVESQRYLEHIGNMKCMQASFADHVCDRSSRH